ncbi:MAG: 5-formyltetrahydrofolate cyclo-ligase [Oligoflexales bacterium]|nr:5-formyltetrahydrofolate cyclo-ligase [Oligoflexales bacterium]
MNRELSKKSLRKDYLDHRKKLVSSFTERSHRDICKHIVDWLEGKNIKQIFMYYPLEGEPDIRFLCHDLKHRIVYGLPVIQNNKTMFFYSWIPGNQLKLSSLGIPEPIPSRQTPLQVSENTLILVPSLAMDFTGIRLGYGGGYYDRFLASTSTEHIMGVLWEDFISDQNLPSNDWDIPLRYAATEAGILPMKPLKD